jgi:VWFA-related protein
MLFRVLGGLVLLGVTLAGRQPPDTASSGHAQPARFGAATAGVLVDVVVRDRRGRPVTDLSAEQFQVFEDGVPQTIVAFEPYSPDDRAASPGDAAAAAGLGKSSSQTTRLAEGPPVIAVAWDRLNPEARALAHAAARRLVETKAPGELVGIFLTDMTLQTVQPYTTDSAKLAAAVEDLATRATSAMTREPGPLDHMVGRAQTPATTGAEDAGYGLAGFPQPKLDVAVTGERPDGTKGSPDWPGMIRMLQRMERTYHQFLYESQGRASMLGLLALIDSLGQLPGRKTLFYFCEGLTIPDSQQQRFRAVIDTANRNTVSVYTFDAAGLRVHSAQQQTAREIRELSFAGLGSSATKSEKWNESLEDNERLLKMDPAVSLGILADQTGGLLVNNTNALDRAMDRINGDRRRHYLLSYVSTNPALDGTYRRIEVRVKRRDVEVRARRGYRAAAAGGARPVLEYELPLMKVLEAAPPPLAFPIQARALSTPMPGRPGLASLVVGFNGLSLSVATDKAAAGYLAEATVMTRVVDEARHELSRTSQQYQFTGEVARQQASLARDVVYFRTPELPPGRHTVEAAVYDGIAEKAAVLRLQLDVAAPDAGVVVGDLFVVSRVEPFDAGEPGAAAHPLAWSGMLLYPSFGEPVSKAANTEAAFALPVVTTVTPEATLELRRGSSTLASAPLPVEEPSREGRLVLYGRLPLRQVPPGVYELRVHVRAGGHEATRSAALTVTP